MRLGVACAMTALVMSLPGCGQDDPPPDDYRYGKQIDVQRADHWLRSTVSPDQVVHGDDLDQKFTGFEHNGVMAYADLVATDKNVALRIDYGGGNVKSM